MRLCSDCGKEDSVFWERADCSCNAPQHGPNDPLAHDPRCKAIGHDVILFPVRMATKDLKWDANGDPHIDQRWTRKGWKLKRDGLRVYREKLLCRNCIALMKDAESRRADYEKACKATRGEPTQTYAQMLASQ